MVKIKTIKKMNLPELIQWGWDNEAIGRFEGDKGSLVLFDANSWVISNKFVCSEEFFEVEIEEEIDEDTKLELIVRFLGRINNEALYTIEYMSINEYLSRFADTLTTHFYVENEDRELVLIWKDGEMVE